MTRFNQVKVVGVKIKWQLANNLCKQELIDTIDHCGWNRGVKILGTDDVKKWCFNSAELLKQRNSQFWE